MLIRSKKELSFYLKADMMMNRGYFKKSLVQRVKNLASPDYVMDYLCAMRKYNYFKQKSICLLQMLYYKRQYLKLGAFLGFSIGDECFEYGLTLMHPGTIVVGQSNRIGKFANLNTSTCIVDNGSRIGDFLFMGTGGKIISHVELGNAAMVAANAVMGSKNNGLGGGVFAGLPASKIRNAKPWIEENGYETDKKWVERVKAIEELHSILEL